MNGRTHAVIGANTVWIPVLLGYQLEYSFLLLLAGTIGGLLPDMDAPKALIHTVSKGFLETFKRVSHHRGFFHSIFGMLVLGIISFVALQKIHPLMPFVFIAGYTSHCIIDGLTIGGVRYLFPLKKKQYLLPKQIRVRVGGIFDHILFAVGLFGIVFFILNYALT